ncbi:MAG: hypothetical protein FGM47_06775 [Candidatus Nanopelagicaceae bacterium]|nr:hypothetical protein [Candidatus Nanopelagicaceae bacterium]
MNNADIYLENDLDDFIPHPTLHFFVNSKGGEDNYQSSNKLYLVPTTHGESYDPDFAPNPSPLAELPNLERWTLTYVVSAIEIMAGRRPVQQLSRSTHRFTYNSLLRNIGSVTDLPKIKRIHRNQPIEGVVEVTAILSFKDRVRALIARFEGVDKKWLCTELELL